MSFINFLRGRLGSWDGMQAAAALSLPRGGFTSLALGGATLGICLVTKCLCPHLCPTSTRSERKIHHQQALHSPTNWACVRQLRRYSSEQTTHSLSFQPNYATTILIPRGIRTRSACYLHSQKSLKISLRLFAKPDPEALPEALNSSPRQSGTVGRPMRPCGVMSRSTRLQSNTGRNAGSAPRAIGN